MSYNKPQTYIVQFIKFNAIYLISLCIYFNGLNENQCYRENFIKY